WCRSNLAPPSCTHTVIALCLVNAKGPALRLGAIAATRRCECGGLMWLDWRDDWLKLIFCQQSNAMNLSRLLRIMILCGDLIVSGFQSTPLLYRRLERPVNSPIIFSFSYSPMSLDYCNHECLCASRRRRGERLPYLGCPVRST